MSKQKDGGSAFPMIESDYHGDGRVFHFSVGGMTLRDWFAGQALAGHLTHAIPISTVPENMLPEEYRAQWAYRQADAMIAEREKQNG